MGFLTKAIDFVYKWIVTLGVVAILGFGAYFSGMFIADLMAKYEILQNQEKQLEEVFDAQVYTLALLEAYQEFNFKFIGAIAEDVVTLHKKPSYEYLSSVTVYLFQYEGEDEEGKMEGSVGTGIIVARHHGYYYIVTNKHVCDSSDATTCFMTPGLTKNGWVELDFVARTESKYDLSLWRTRDMFDHKQPIKGIATAYPQNPVFSVGHYLANPFIYTEGTFSGYQGDYALYNLPCAPGCSGSGVFDNDGNLIGVIFAGNRIGPFQMDTAKIMGVDGDVIRLFLRKVL